jgi:hypothetical protein
MKTNKVLLHLAIIGGILGSAATSHALVGVSLVGGATSTTPQMTTATGAKVTTKAKTGLLGGALLDLGLSGMTSFETGALYNISRFSGNTNGVDFTLSVPSVNVPVLIRFHPLPLLSFGLGGYYSYRTGNVKVESISVPNVSIANNTSKSDYGAVGSVRLHLPVGALTTFIVDGRYLYGIPDLDKTGAKFKTRQIQAFAGLRFGI